MLPRRAPKTIGEGKREKRERAEMRMMRLADLSSGWTTLRLMMLPPTLAVEARKETMEMKAMVTENMASQEEGQKSCTASSLCWASGRV